MATERINALMEMGHKLINKKLLYMMIITVEKFNIKNNIKE